MILSFLPALYFVVSWLLIFFACVIASYSDLYESQTAVKPARCRLLKRTERFSSFLLPTPGQSWPDFFLCRENKYARSRSFKYLINRSNFKLKLTYTCFEIRTFDFRNKIDLNFGYFCAVRLLKNLYTFKWFVF